MARILGIDYGKKRTGLAVSDPLKIVATALETVETEKLLGYLKQYFLKETVETVVIGLPIGLDGKDTDSTESVLGFIRLFKVTFTEIPIVTADERFTSKMAFRSMIDSGMNKKDRRVKGNIDKISAVIILRSYMDTL
jgi:putative holliday junction resolvase